MGNKPKQYPAKVGILITQYMDLEPTKRPHAREIVACLVALTDYDGTFAADVGNGRF